MTSPSCLLKKSSNMVLNIIWLSTVEDPSWILLCTNYSIFKHLNAPVRWSTGKFSSHGGPKRLSIPTVNLLSTIALACSLLGISLFLHYFSDYLWIIAFLARPFEATNQGMEATPNSCCTHAPSWGFRLVGYNLRQCSHFQQVLQK